MRDVGKSLLPIYGSVTVSLVGLRCQRSASGVVHILVYFAVVAYVALRSFEIVARLRKIGPIPCGDKLKLGIITITSSLLSKSNSKL